jgi:MFS family permease
MRIIRGEPRISLLFLIAALPMIGEGFIGTLIVAWISQALGGGDLEFGYIMSAQAVGGILGSLFVARVAKRVPLYRLLGISAILFGLIDLVIFNYPTFIPGVLPGVILMALVGIPGVGYGTSLNTMLQNAMPDEYRGRVFGAFGMVAAILGLLGTIVAGYLGETISAVTLLNVQGLGYVVTGALALALLKRHYSSRTSEPVQSQTAVG